MKQLTFFLFAVSFPLLTHAQKNSLVNQAGMFSPKDSIELSTLVKNIYKWQDTKFKNNDFGFPYKFNNTSDSIFTGIDWEQFDKTTQILRKTNFFTEDFFVIRHNIALTLDSSMKLSSIEWRNINDGIPVWSTEVDDWCSCQDNPDHYWKLMTIKDLKLKDSTVSFKWTWGDHGYQMRARKEDDLWKISYLEGLKNYGNVAHYKKIMSE